MSAMLVLRLETRHESVKVPGYWIRSDHKYFNILKSTVV